MKRQLATLACTAILVAGCGGKDKQAAAPTGQVVATVGGDEITASELKLELGAAGTDPVQAAARQDAALQSIINRKILVAAAIDRKLDKSPLAAMAKDKANDLAMIELLQLAIQSSVPKISDQEATDFVSEHPASFGQRKLISVDQLIVPRVDMATVKAMQPLDTLGQIIALLDSKKIVYRRTANVLDTLNVDPDAAGKIAALGVGEVFVSPIGTGVQVSEIREMRPEPLTGPEAMKAAQAILANKRAGTQVRTQMEELIKAGQSKVSINPAYKPKTKPAAPGAPAAPAN